MPLSDLSFDKDTDPSTSSGCGTIDLCMLSVLPSFTHNPSPLSGKICLKVTPPGTIISNFEGSVGYVDNPLNGGTLGTTECPPG